ncbi:EMC6-like membrane protein [Methanoplanus limicola]|uniref:Uncharacterized protein n=1 Tax=Methanoplanus limicola DSM 2279 TaxID=937775 RepID=H1Z4B7_9EURY|nr:hypothetical protein [Methanoplanus limicola]EHQ36665.1 hypothetical protein Metlim_2624 [Methanoplanus limicola DSM 2279]
MTDVYMSEEISADPITEKISSKSDAEKVAGHQQRMIRTCVGCFMGIITGVLSYLFIGDPVSPAGEPKAILGWLLLLAGIVFQKHVFMALKIDYSELGAKDWFYQGFMAFAFWFISWTVLLSIN